MAVKTVALADLENSDITEVVLVGGSARIPYLRQKLREKFDHEPRTDVNPDEAVAVGAALYADSLFNKAESVVRATCRLRDVTSLSLGIQIKGDVFSVIVPRNSPLPIAITKPYTTTVDEQTTIGVKVYQGQHPKASANAFILEFSVNEIRKLPAGEPSVDVTIELNEEGTLKVTARDKTPGSAGCTETRSVAKDRRRLRDAEIAAMNARVVASSHAFARLRDTLLAKDNVLATLARGRMLHSELTTEAPGKPRPVITPALTALKTLLDSTKAWAERPEETFKTETRASCAAKDRALKDAANAVRPGYM